MDPEKSPEGWPIQLIPGEPAADTDPLCCNTIRGFPSVQITVLSHDSPLVEDRMGRRSGRSS